MRFNEFPEGQILEFGASALTAAEIVEFATRYDPQPFHIDPVAEKATMLRSAL
jgi:acyl dehydratase